MVDSAFPSLRQANCGGACSPLRASQTGERDEWPGAPARAAAGLGTSGKGNPFSCCVRCGTMLAVMATDAGMQTSAERGFTLIELLVAVLMVSVLAAVVLPMANRFADSGNDEARLTEFHDVTTGVILLMTHNQLFSIPNPVTGNTAPCTVGTKVLSEFPDTDSDNGQGAGNDGGKELDIFGVPYNFIGNPNTRDRQGYVLYDHDAVGGDAQAALFNYLFPMDATYCYTTDSDGTVHQYLEDGAEQTS